MTPFILRRLVIAIPVLVGISISTYLFLTFAPGDPVTAMLSPEQVSSLGPEWVEQQRERLGLNDPFPVRYGRWMQEVVSGNLGYSYRGGDPVAELIFERLGPTLRLMAAAMTLAILFGIPLGIISALKQYSWIDYLVTVLGFAAVSVPSFFLALGLIYIFALKLQWLPTAGMNTVGQPPELGDSLRHLILPAVALGLAQMAPLIRYVRSGMLEVTRQDFITVARAKGLSEHVVVFRHALRNVLIPIVTIVAIELPGLFGGAVIIEQIFSWPGMGTLAITAVLARDYPVIMGVTLIGALVIVISNLIADVLYAVIDPRIRYR